MVNLELLEYEEKELKKEYDGGIGKKTLDLLMELNERYVDESTGTKKEFLYIREYSEKSKVKIKAKNWVGIVSINDWTLEILPKFIKKDENWEENREKTIKNLVKMLQIAWDLPIRDVDISSLKIGKNSIFEVLLTIYSIKLLDTIKEGLYKEYIRVSDDLRYVKGQIDFAKYSQRWERRHIIPVNYNDRNPDNLINRTLKYATYLASMYTRNSTNFSNLKVAENLMDSVSLVPIGASEIDSITFTRLNEGYKPLINLARVIITNLSPEFTGGKKDVFAFLIPMEKVFEKFVANFLRDYVLPKCCPSARIYIQEETRHFAKRGAYLMKGGRFQLKPDILIKVKDRNHIIDTKYKRINMDERNVGISQQDAYQMLAYTLAFKSEKTMLLYPQSLVDERLLNDKDKSANLYCDWEFVDHVSELQNRKLCIGTIKLDDILENDGKKLADGFKEVIGEFISEANTS